MRALFRDDDVKTRDHIIMSIAFPAAVIVLCLSWPTLFWSAVRAVGITYQIKYATLVSSNVVPSHYIGINSSRNRSWELKMKVKTDSLSVDEVGFNSRINLVSEADVNAIASSIVSNNNAQVSTSKWLRDSYIVVPGQSRFLHIVVGIGVFGLIVLAGLRSAVIVIQRKTLSVV